MKQTPESIIKMLADSIRAIQKGREWVDELEELRESIEEILNEDSEEE